MELTSTKLTWEKSPVCLILILIFFYYSSPAQEAPNAWINEIHYDNVGGDSNEGIEIVVEAGFPEFDIKKLGITLYNGNNRVGGGILEFAETHLSKLVGPFAIYAMEISGIENGAPDGIALSYDGELIQFISYEGSFTGIGGVADGITSEDIGVTESSDTPMGHSLQLNGSGDQYKAFSWNEAATETFGEENNGQSLLVIDEPQPVTNFKFDRIAPDKVKISWDKPIGVYGEDWSGVLVFASHEGPNDVDLVGSDYTTFSGGDQVFGNGTKISDSHVVVRKDNDNDGVYVITGFDPTKTYHFIAYTAFVVSGTGDDLFSEPSEEIVVSPKVEDITELQTVPLGQKARLSWKNQPQENEDHDWWHEILLVASEDPISFIPDQKTYSPNKTFGSGDSPAPGEFVVYQGTDSTAFVHGLVNGKEYHFKTFVRYDAADEFYWSAGVETSGTPFENSKTWTGIARNSLYSDPNNWNPVGVPESSHDVILDNSNVDQTYEVQYTGSSDLEANSITISPQDVNSAITLDLKSAVDSKIKLTLHDDISPLNVSDYGVLINSMVSINEAIQTPNGKIILDKEAKYIHNTASGHTDILKNIVLEDEAIPGTIEFNIPAFVSLAGRSFSSLIFSSANPGTFTASGSNPITIKKALTINENVKLNLISFAAPLIIEGDLKIDGELLFDNEINFIGDKIQTLSGQKVSPIVLSKLLINKLDNRLLLDSDLAIKEKLEISSGTIETGENQVILDFAAYGELEFLGDAGNIAGNLAVTRNVSAQETAFVHAGVKFKEGMEDLGAVSVVRNTGAAIENGASRSIRKNWTMTSPSTLNSARNVEFVWSESDEEEDFDPSSVQLWQESADETEWTAIGEAQDGSSRSITSVVERLSRFTIADTDNPLPITLLSFQVKQRKNNALLAWSTLQESNNEGFEIQKSVDKNTFYKIGFVTGNNTTSEKKYYEYEDETHDESTYYRLKQIDYDGAFSYSPIRFLPKTSINSELLFSPNPVSSPISISFSTSNPDYQNTLDYCYLHSSQGTKMFETHNPNITILEKDLDQLISDLNSGLYVLTLSLNNQVQKIKIIKE